MDFLIGVFVGMCGVIGTLMFAGRFEPDIVQWKPLPGRMQTLAAWGAPARSAFRPGRVSLPVIEHDMLPRRVPGSALINNQPPPEPVPLHTSVYKPKRPWWPPHWLRVRWLRTKNHFLLAEVDAAFTAWWADAWFTAYPVAQRGRHRQSDQDTEEWRTEWAKHDTQHWPTLSTTGHAWDIIGQDVRPVICTKALMAQPRQFASVT